jgi:hypothetical protein
MAQQVERKSQTQWDAERAEAKAKAAVTIEENRVAAIAARDAALKGDVVEAPDEEQGYADYKVDELKGFLTERGLEVSGNKAELIARLEESDAE